MNDDAPKDPRIARGMERQMVARAALLDEGATAIGWKAGMGIAPAMERLGTTGPLAGFLTDRTLLASGAEIDVSGYAAPIVEPEIALRIGARVRPGADRAEVAAAIDAAAPAIEIADLHDLGDDVEGILAANIFHRAVVLGEFDTSRAGARVDDVRVDLDGEQQRYAEAAVPETLLGDLVEVVRHVGEHAAAAGHLLRPGDVIITGSIVPPVAVVAPERITARFAGLGAVSVGVR